jgi:isoquinoline 1-oxidoreductase beta subunit
MLESPIDRRRFFKLTAAGVFGTGLVLAMTWDGAPGKQKSAGKDFQPNAWLKIGDDGRVVVYTIESEMGQGPLTLMPMILAEELEVAWDDIRVEHAPLKPVYGYQSTGGSASIRRGWATLRDAGATAREMLIAAAAQRWNVPPSDCYAAESRITHKPSGRQLSFGELALAAAALPIPEKVRLKSPDEYRIVGHPVPRIDIPQKLDGSAQYGIDVDLPGQVYATTVHCPVFGGKAKHIDASRAQAIPGVQQIFAIDNAVAVVADDTWTAMKAADALRIEWDEGAHKNLNTEQIRAQLEKAARNAATVDFQRGDVAKAMRNTTILQAGYHLAFQAHAAMEPMNCTAWVRDGRCEVWAPTQSPSAAHETATKFSLSTLKSYREKLYRKLDIAAENAVEVHTTLLGGGFGRRLQQDYVAEAVQIAKQAGKPVKLTWSRREDIQHDFYHPATYHWMEGSVDAKGKPLAWHHRLAGVRNPGAAELPYAIPHVKIEMAPISVNVPTGPWRSVSQHYYAFAQETFFDELARFGKQDPLQLRLELLQDPRLRHVLELAADKAGWGKTLPEGRFMGVAAHFSFGTYVAEAVEIVMDAHGNIKVPRVVVAIDCGIVINPDIIRAQMESSVAFALPAALNAAITIENGRVQQSNFLDFPILRPDEMPKVETHIVRSTESPQGIGEPGVPPLAPALANAVFAATGKPVRSLPIGTLAS